MKLTRENLVSPLGLHVLVVVLLGLTTLVLGVRLLLTWNTLRADNPERMQQDQAQLKTLQLQTAPLRGLPEKVATSREQADKFFGARIPSNYSSVASELGDVAQRNAVRLLTIQYAQAPALNDLLELRLNANLSGDYVPMMKFINNLERDKTFFVINGLTLTGQQGGQVNLRLRLTTYLHGANLDRAAPPVAAGGDGAAPEGQ